MIWLVINQPHQCMVSNAYANHTECIYSTKYDMSYLGVFTDIEY